MASTLLQAKKCDQTTSLPPNWDGKLWKADHVTESIIWKDSQGDFYQIDTNDPEFDDFVCTSVDDYLKIVRIIDSCRNWESFVKKQKNLEKIKSCFLDK